MAKQLNSSQRRSGSYIKKHEEWMSSPAYRDLKPTARCLLDEFQRIYRPTRNGQLCIGTRKAADLCNVSENTAGNAFHELVEHGFIVLTKGELWMERKTREWRLTIEPTNNREPTDEWKRWAAGKPVATLPRKNPTLNLRQNCLKNGGRLPQKQGQSNSAA